MPRVIHFEIYAEKPERAAKFYTDVFGWKFQRWNSPIEYWLVSTGEKEKSGIDGGLVRRHGPIRGESVIAYVCTIDVPAVDEYSKKVASAGGIVTRAKMPVPGIGWLAYCKDTEGNVFGMMQNDPDAK